MTHRSASSIRHQLYAPDHSFRSTSGSPDPITDSRIPIRFHNREINTSLSGALAWFVSPMGWMHRLRIRIYEADYRSVVFSTIVSVAPRAELLFTEINSWGKLSSTMLWRKILGLVRLVGALSSLSLEWSSWSIPPHRFAWGCMERSSDAEFLLRTGTVWRFERRILLHYWTGVSSRCSVESSMVRPIDFHWISSMRTSPDVVVKKTVQGRNWSTKAWEPALHARTRQVVHGGELGT